jgi:hypothetical protein
VPLKKFWRKAVTLKRFVSWLVVLLGLGLAGYYLYMSYAFSEHGFDNRALYVLWGVLGVGSGYFLSSGVDMLDDNPRRKK